MRKEIITPGAGREPLGPYSTAVRAGGFVWVSGQLGWDAQLPGLVPGGIQAECRRALENLSSVLDDAGLTLNDVVKVTVFLADIADWPAVNALWSEVFGEHPPARSAVAVAALPANARIEIDAVAVDTAAP
jgi:2-iminobutanoate/2-iminopropanoate deaminase